MSNLKEYQKKRNFSKTKEPRGKISKSSKKTIFVVQKHSARSLHYDFRIEVDGVLKSWAVPKGPSTNPKDKRLAIHVEDHPLEYGNFEGVIEKGNYGAGNVEIWDKGFFINSTIKDGKPEPLSKWIDKGHFMIYLKGDRLRGKFAFNRMKDNNWLLIKMKETFEENLDSKFIKVKNKTIEITHAKKEIFANIIKEDFVNYYKKVAKLMLPHIKDRPISMYRMPDGLRNEGFFQKHVPDYFPSWVKKVKITRKESKIKYVIANDEASIVYLATQMVVPHIWSSRIDKLNYPDRMIFDLDPSVNDFKKTQEVALEVNKFLKSLKLPSYIMTSGNKGYHIIVPLDRSANQKEVKEFSEKIAKTLVKNFPKLMTNELRIKKREDKVMIDTLRNAPTSTAVAPYSVRASLRGGIAMPIEWKEVKKINPHHFTLDNYNSRIKKEIWKNIYKKGISIEKITSF